MGGFIQPQARTISQCHVGRKPRSQAALHRPRFCLNPDATVALEEGMPEKTFAALSQWVIPSLL
jgi:hypothetical protein